MKKAIRPTIVARLNALADATRGRLLFVLERHELTVSELCSVLQLPQSTVSRHLKILADEGWVAARADGASNRYQMALQELEPSGRRLWQVVRDELAASSATARDAERVGVVLARRQSRSQEFFSSSAGQWDRLRTELFGQRTELMPLLGLLDSGWTVGDLGCGTGHFAAMVAPFVERVVAVDGSSAMLKAARARLAGRQNVEIRRGELESLPIEERSLDLAVLALVLHYIAVPGEAIREAARTLKPGGRVVILDMLPHDHAEYRQTMGHVWQGFATEQLDGWLADAGLTPGPNRPLPADPAVKGPGLFIATARMGA